MATTPKKSKGTTVKKDKKPKVPAVEPSDLTATEALAEVAAEEAPKSETKVGVCEQCGVPTKTIGKKTFSGVDCPHFPNRKPEHVFPVITEKQKKDQLAQNR